MRQTHERFVLMRRILSYFYDLCVFTFPRVQCWLPCVSLTSLDPWYLTPVSPSLSPGPLWFLPSFMDRTPTWLRASLMVPVSSVCGLLPPPPVHLDFVPVFFFHLLQNCKSNKSFNTLSQRSSAFPTSTHLFPPICPVTVVVVGGGRLSRMLLNQTLLCCMLWQRQWTLSGPLPRTVLSPLLAPRFCLSHWLFKMF